MKRLLTVSLVLLSCYCIAHKGKEKTIRLKYPEGMKYVPSGAFKMKGDDNGAEERTIQMMGFYMDAAEVTNEQYREFVNYVRDSIANTLLGNVTTLPDGSTGVVMKKIKWNDPEVQHKLAPMYDPQSVLAGTPRIDMFRLMYHYSVFDYKAFKRNPGESGFRYVHTIDIPVQPDTTVFSKAMNRSAKDPFNAAYFSLAAFNDYPVVGVTQQQAKAYCDWRTRKWKDDNGYGKNGIESSFRLPTEEEWEYAASAGSPAANHIIEPTSGITAMFSSPSESGIANDFGLYNMAGNVSEWTATRCAGCENEASDFLDPGAPIKKRNLVVRGGNWSYQIPNQQPGVKILRAQDSAYAYVGFRCVFTQVMTNLPKK